MVCGGGTITHSRYKHHAWPGDNSEINVLNEYINIVGRSIVRGEEKGRGGKGRRRCGSEIHYLVLLKKWDVISDNVRGREVCDTDYECSSMS